MDLFSMFMRGGTIMWPILACSIIGLGITIDRYLMLRKARTNATGFIIKIRSLLKKKDIEGAIAVCLQERTPAANIIRQGLKRYRFGHARVKEAIENIGRREVIKLEKGLNVLATVAGMAPLLGFLGTVTGMITAFQRIEELKGNANPSDLAGGIWEALLTTAFGLGVGIIALVAYNYFISEITKVVSDIEIISNDVVDTLEETEAGIKAVDDEDFVL